MHCSCIGIIGDGQLARMMIESANRLGLDYKIFGNSDDSSAGNNANVKHIVRGNLLNRDDLFNFCSTMDIITVEIEHFNLTAVRDALKEQKSKRIYPPLEVLDIISDKFEQKCWLIRNEIGTSRLICSSNAVSELEEGIRLVVKKKKLGYDGKGVEFIDSFAQLKSFKKQLYFGILEKEYFFEEKVNFVAELAVTVCRKGINIRTYPCVESIQIDGMCRVVLAPAPYPEEVLRKADELARKVALNLDLVGILTVEMFYTRDGDVIVNEIAPRPHNTAHYTIDACVTSQFEQIMRIAANLPLGSTKMLCETAVMINLVGDSHNEILNIFETRSRQFSCDIENASLHLYKKLPSIGRKLGHITVVGSSYHDTISSILTASYSQKNSDLLPVNTIKILSSILPRVSSFTPMNLLSTPSISSKMSDIPVALVMGSASDLPVMEPAIKLLKKLEINCFATVVSAHRTPDRMYEFAKSAQYKNFKVIIAAAGGAAHLPGMVASMTQLPVIGVPVAQKHLSGADSLYSIVQMPTGVPVATVAINNSTNAAILAAKILSINDTKIALRVAQYISTIQNKAITDAEFVEKSSKDETEAVTKGEAKVATEGEAKAIEGEAKATTEGEAKAITEGEAKAKAITEGEAKVTTERAAVKEENAVPQAV